MSDFFDVFDLFSQSPAADQHSLTPFTLPDLVDTPSFEPWPFDPLHPLDPLPSLEPLPSPEILVPDLFQVPDLPQPTVDPFLPGSLIAGAGDASVSDDHWHSQGEEQACAVVSQGSIIEQITGHPFDLTQTTQWLEERGWYDPLTGTTPQDCGRLLDAYGIAHKDGPATVVELYDALLRGDQVMVALDANEIWFPQEDASGRPIEQPGSAGHAVWVTEIGRDPLDGQWKVVINDSAHPGGRANTLSLADFLEATDDFDGFSVIADAHSYDGRPGPFGARGGWA